MNRPAVSSLAFIVAGQASHLLPGDPTIADVGYNLLMTVLGVASVYYHAGKQHGNHWDVGAMFALGIYIWLVTIAGEPLWWKVVGALVIAGIGAYGLRMRQLDVRMEGKIAGLFGIVYGTALMFTSLSPYVMASVGLITLALFVRSKSHTAWHLIAAPALALLWIGVRLWQVSLPPLS